MALELSTLEKLEIAHRLIHVPKVRRTKTNEQNLVGEDRGGRRRERGKPVYQPIRAYPNTNHEAKTNEENVVPEDTVRLDYEFVLRGGREEVVRVKSQLILPMALALENLPQTESSFPELIDRVLVQPLNTKFRAFLQRRFDAESRAAIEKEAAEKEIPAPANKEFKGPKPGNGVAFTMPEIDCKPPLPQRPSSRDWRSQ